jgi:hypothetical protein
MPFNAYPFNLAILLSLGLNVPYEMTVSRTMCRNQKRKSVEHVFIT